MWRFVCLGCVVMLGLGSLVHGGPVVRHQQVVGVTNSLRCWEHNGARHVVRDAAGRVHMIWIDGHDVQYVRGVQGDDGSVVFSPVERVNDDLTRPRMTLLAEIGRASCRERV